MIEAPSRIWIDPEGTISRVKIISEDVEYIRADIVEGMRKELSMALNVFRCYERYHQAKGSDDKAFANKTYADLIEAALKRLEKE